MPHITVNIVPGHSEEEKQRLAEKLHQTAQDELNMDGKFISVSVKEVEQAAWSEYISTVPKGSFYVKPKY